MRKITVTLHIPLKLSFTQNVLTAKTRLTIKILVWNWHTNKRTPHIKLSYNFEFQGGNLHS